VSSPSECVWTVERLDVPVEDGVTFTLYVLYDDEHEFVAAYQWPWPLEAIAYRRGVKVRGAGSVVSGAAA